MVSGGRPGGKAEFMEGVSADDPGARQSLKSQGAGLGGEDHGWGTQEDGVCRNGTPSVSARSPEHWDREQELVGPLAGQA